MGLDNPLHILIVLVVVLMLFGAKRLPEMGRGIGEGMRSFKQGISGEHTAPVETPHTQPAPAQQVALSPAPAPVPAATAPAATAQPVASTAARESAPIA